MTTAERADNLPVNEKDLKSLLSDIPKELRGFKALLYLIAGTGMSLSDSLQIRLQDIDTSRNSVKVYDKWVARTRFVKLNATILEAIRDYQDGKYRPDERLFGISEDTAANRLYQHSQRKLGRPVSWISIRRSWAVMAFNRGMALRDMVNSSGASPGQLATWSVWSHGEKEHSEPADILAGLVK